MMAGVALSLLFPSLFFLILFTVLLMVLEKKNFSLLNVYLTLVSFVSLVGLVIGFGIALHEGVSRLITTDDEYVVSDYQYRNCRGTNSYDSARQSVKKADAEVKSCQDDRRADALLSRNVDFKKVVVGGGTWGLLFLIVFLAHYPRFVRSYRAAKEESAA